MLPSKQELVVFCDSGTITYFKGKNYCDQTQGNEVIYMADNNAELVFGSKSSCTISASTTWKFFYDDGK